MQGCHQYSAPDKKVIVNSTVVVYFQHLLCACTLQCLKAGQNTFFSMEKDKKQVKKAVVAYHSVGRCPLQTVD